MEVIKSKKNRCAKIGCIASIVFASILCLFVFPRIFFIYFFLNDKIYDKKDLTDNYDRNEKDIAALISYFKSIIPEDTYVDIEINDTKKIDIFHVYKEGVYYGGWDIDIDSPKADTIFSILNWDKLQIQILKKKLDAVNCISIDNSYPVNIGFQRSLLSKFYYTIFDEPIIENDSLMRIYDSKCMYIFYRDNVVLKYGSGAIGSICFPKRFLE